MTGLIVGVVKVILPKPPRTVLVICLRRLGDVLLTTPLAMSIRFAYPRARIDWLVFEGTEGILQENRAADKIFTLQPAAGKFRALRLASSICQRYDLAISTQAGDRPSFLARIAGRRVVTFRSTARGALTRDWIFSAVVSQDQVHRVEQILTLLDPLGVRPHTELSAPMADFSFVETRLFTPYVVLHPGAAFRYKRWTTHGWRDLAIKFINAGFTVVVTGGEKAEEKCYLDQIFESLNVVRADAALTWPQITGLLTRASYFVGVDTSVTHLAAACNLSGLAIFGPTDPALWRPYTQSSNNPMSVVQNPLPCVPCQKEGCERHSESHSLCLDTLGASTVWSRVAFKSRHSE